MTYTPEQRDQLTRAAVGKVIAALVWEPEDRYWVIAFTDGTELCVRLMAELVSEIRPSAPGAPPR